jgi:polyhydroxyalkanoate synthesis regulator phasin
MADNVKEIIKKTLLFGIGVGAITKEKADELVNEMKKKGYVDVKEGKKLVNDLLGQSLRAQKQVRNLIETQVKAAMRKSPFATKQELRNLEKKLKKRHLKKK